MLVDCPLPRNSSASALRISVKTVKEKRIEAQLDGVYGSVVAVHSVAAESFTIWRWTCDPRLALLFLQSKIIMKSTQGQCQIDSQAVNQNTFSEYGKYFEYIVKCATSSPETFNFCCKNCTSRVKGISSHESECILAKTTCAFWNSTCVS